MIKQRVYHLVERGAHGSTVNLVFDYTIMLLIVLNVFALMLETIPEVSKTYGLYLRVFDVFSVIVFSLEYCLRIYVSDLTHPASSRFKSVLRFVFSAYGLIDLMAILPFYLPLFIRIDLRFLRILRLMRFLRVLKINRYNSSLNLIFSVVKEKKADLALTGFVALLVLFVASFLMYYVEGDAQPDKFPNLLACLWWAIATLTTVGYGDVYPITGMGKFLSGVIAVLGIGLVALPTGLISAGFVDKLGKKDKEVRKCPHCGKEIE
jgi:voltage-gated potassium channel